MILLMRFVVSGHSMLPTFKPGQTLLVGSIPYLFRKPKVGDVVIVKDPRDPSKAGQARLLLKRITKIEQNRHSGEERSDDTRITSKLKRFWTSQNDNTKYFVAGDNPKDSRDSRAFGFVYRKNILGRMLFIE